MSEKKADKSPDLKALYDALVKFSTSYPEEIQTLINLDHDRFNKLAAELTPHVTKTAPRAPVEPKKPTHG